MAGQGSSGSGASSFDQGIAGSGQMAGQRSGSSSQESGGFGQTERKRSGGSGGSGSAPSDIGEIGQQAVSQAQEQAVKIVGQAREQVEASVKTQTARGFNDCHGADIDPA